MDKTQVPATQGVGEVIQCGKYPHPWEDSFRRKATASLLNASTGKVRDFIIPGNKDAVCLKKADAMTTDNEQKSLSLITYVMESNLYTFEREKMMQSLDKDLVAPSTPSYPVLSLGGHGVQPFGFNGLERVPGKDSRHLFIQAWWQITSALTLYRRFFLSSPQLHYRGARVQRIPFRGAHTSASLRRFPLSVVRKPPLSSCADHQAILHCAAGYGGKPQPNAASRLLSRRLIPRAPFLSCRACV